MPNLQRKQFSIDFIGIGAEKSGTTWLAKCLEDHPEVSFPVEKDLYFFNDYDKHFLNIRNYRYERGMDWYEKNFRGCGKDKVIGEMTPVYIYSKKAAQRIKKHFPNAKLIAVLRDPLSRAMSQYFHDVRLGIIKDIGFPKAIKSYNNYIQKGLYYKHLKDFYSLFPKENMRVILLEDIEKDPQKTMEVVYTFLGLKKTKFKSKNLHSKINGAGKTIFPELNRVMIKTDYFLSQKKYDSILRFIEALGIRRLAISIREMNKSKFPEKHGEIDQITKKYLKKVFRSDIEKLETLIGRDLSVWK